MPCPVRKLSASECLAATYTAATARTGSPASTKVIETAEKIQISNYCSTGLYYFRTAGLFTTAFQAGKQMPTSDIKNELYIAPLYNLLIGNGNNIQIHLVDISEVVFCGTPTEYYDYLKLAKGE